MAKGRSNVRADSKKKQASKLAEIHQILIAAGFDTAAKQAAALHLSRSTAWAFLHLNKRAGPSSVLLKRLLASKIPPRVREKIYEYIEEKRLGLYGHHERICKEFGAKFQMNNRRAKPWVSSQTDSVGQLSRLVK